jgi:hypothetical protein
MYMGLVCVCCSLLSGDGGGGGSHDSVDARHEACLHVCLCTLPENCMYLSLLLQGTGSSWPLHLLPRTSPCG